MIRVIASFQVKPEQTAKAIGLATELVKETREEKGCAQYVLVQAAGDPNRLVILEGWESEADLNVHSASAHFTRLVPQLAQLCEYPPAVVNYEQLV